MNRTLVNLLTHNAISPAAATYFTTWSNLTYTFNSRPNKKPNFNIIKTETGLFDVPQLNSHQGFYLLKEKCTAKTNLLMEEAVSQNRSRKIVEIFDELSDSLCKVADLAEFIRIAHPSFNYVQAAEIASATVSSIVEKLNTNKKLYFALLNVIEGGDTVPTNAVDDLVARLFLFDFEQSGIHLSKEERLKVVALNDSILSLGQRFIAGSTNPRIISKQSLPENVRHIFTVDGDNVIVSGLCADSPNPIAREIAYRVYLYPDEQQNNLLTKLLQARYELAQTCGFPTYAHRALKGSTLETPENVLEFLDYLSEGLKQRASTDFKAMEQMKQDAFINSGPLEHWDTPYFTKLAKKELFHVQSSEYAPYFSLGACMEGLNNLLQNLFGVTLVNEEVGPGECWTPDIYKLAVVHETEGLLGHIYCDFYERQGKPNQDCHFTIRGGKMLEDGSYQNPIVVLMLNFPLPCWSSPTLLSPNMLDNLFHEMGHAMHSMLARTYYQHITGTRCSTDFAEVPSVLMEYFSNDVRVLKTFACHFQTKKQMPEEMLHRLCAAKNLFMASEMQLQVFYSALDQIYHGKYPLEGTTTEVLSCAQKKYFGLPYIQETAWQLRFGHLVGYGAKYYSYLVSRAMASCIWQNYFEKDPLNRTQGERYRRECLSHGGGKHPRKLIGDFLKQEPSTDLLVNSLLKDIDNKQYEGKTITSVNS